MGQVTQVRLSFCYLVLLSNDISPSFPDPHVEIARMSKMQINHLLAHLPLDKMVAILADDIFKCI